MNSGLQFYEGITTREIQSILVKSAHDLISTESPNYQFRATITFVCNSETSIQHKVEGQ